MDTFTDATWDRAVLASPVPVVVGFWAEWCVPCHMAQPALESAEQHHGGRLRFGLVNFDENPGLIERYGVQALPTLLIIKGGKVSEQRVGLISRDNLVKLIEPHLG